MITKTYGMLGTAESSLLFIRGGVKVRANFSGGILDPKRHRPATLTTSNQVVQLVLEHTPEFLSGKIYLISVNDTEDVQVEVTEEEIKALKATKRARATKVEKRTYEDVKTIGDAVSVLTSLGAEAAELDSPESVLLCASKYNAIFPNLSLK